MPMYNVDFKINSKARIRCNNIDELKEIIEHMYSSGKFGKIEFTKIEKE